MIQQQGRQICFTWSEDLCSCRFLICKAPTCWHTENRNFFLIFFLFSDLLFSMRTWWFFFPSSSKYGSICLLCQCECREHTFLCLFYSLVFLCCFLSESHRHLLGKITRNYGNGREDRKVCIDSWRLYSRDFTCHLHS